MRPTGSSVQRRHSARRRCRRPGLCGCPFARSSSRRNGAAKTRLRSPVTPCSWPRRAMRSIAAAKAYRRFGEALVLGQRRTKRETHSPRRSDLRGKGECRRSRTSACTSRRRGGRMTAAGPTREPLLLSIPSGSPVPGLPPSHTRRAERRREQADCEHDERAVHALDLVHRAPFPGDRVPAITSGRARMAGHNSRTNRSTSSSRDRYSRVRTLIPQRSFGAEARSRWRCGVRATSGGAGRTSARSRP